jgi:hypothetical protein
MSIIELAKQAGLKRHQEQAPGIDGVVGSWADLERFAALVAAAERKRIADIIRSDKYGIGNMCSQWTSDDVADDILEGQS